MTTGRTETKRRRWADVVVIVASLYAFMSSFWAPLELLTGGAGREVAEQQGLWWSYAIGGVLGLVALFFAHRGKSGIAKVLAALAGLAVLSGFFTLDDLTLFATISMGLTGIALLAAAPFIGPMPSPEEEGKSRTPGANRHR